MEFFVPAIPMAKRFVPEARISFYVTIDAIEEIYLNTLVKNPKCLRAMGAESKDLVKIIMPAKFQNFSMLLWISLGILKLGFYPYLHCDLNHSAKIPILKCPEKSTEASKNFEILQA
mgnify:CR=1 FL=1